MPKWDLPLVLRHLKDAPYEPLEAASLEHLSKKTAFLLALASGRRRSELHAFSGEDATIRFTQTLSKVTLLTAPGFLAKNQPPDLETPEVVIPALPRGTADARGRFDRKLCPVRALKAYLDRVSTLRKGRRRLFIPSSTRTTSEIRPDTISKWIQSVVREAYSACPEVEQPEGRVSAHEVRALSTSWRAFNRGCAIGELMQAAFWRSEDTFATFYLRDMCGQALDLYSLGPIVASQAIIQAPVGT